MAAAVVHPLPARGATPLGDAAAAMAALAKIDLDGLTSTELTELVTELHEMRSTLEATEARVLSRWDAEGCWRADGAKTGAAWLSWRLRIPEQTARERMRHARELRSLPAAEAAWVAGEIDRSHLTTLLAARNRRNEVAFQEDHAALVEAARTSRFIDFKRRCDMWRLRTDPDGAEQGADCERAAREVHLSQTMDGMWYGKITLDPVSGTKINTSLRSIERELYLHDRAEAKERLGRDPLTVELARTPAQRRADAWVEMAERAESMPPGARRPVPLITVLVGYETFAGPILELANRTVITEGTFLRLLEDGADIERIVFDGASRVIDVGTRTRFYRGALRRAVEVRDRTCFHPTCDEVPERPHIDHIHEYAKGGHTTQEDGRLGCDFHNLLRNEVPDEHWEHLSPQWPEPHELDAGPDPPDP